MSETTCTMVGFVATEVRQASSAAGTPIASFRLGLTPRRYDRAKGGWSDGQTYFVTVTCFKSLARNVQSSVRKGDPVIVHGRFRIAQWEKDGRSGISAEVDASSIGHDLTRGTSAFLWTPREDRADSDRDVAADLARSLEGTEDTRSFGERAGVRGPATGMPGSGPIGSPGPGRGADDHGLGFLDGSLTGTSLRGPDEPEARGGAETGTGRRARGSGKAAMSGSGTSQRAA